jgi:hypothetical protein
LKLGVWLRTQIESETALGELAAKAFCAHDRARASRRVARATPIHPSCKVADTFSNDTMNIIRGEHMDREIILQILRICREVVGARYGRASLDRWQRAKQSEERNVDLNKKKRLIC